MLSVEKENSAPKKPRLSLQLKKKPKEEKKDFMKERFPLLPNEVVEDTKKQVIPKNTDKSTKWAVRLFQSWCEQRNERCDDKVPNDILLSDNHEELCRWLCICVSELRKEDGSEYTPRSISMFMAGLQRYIYSENKSMIKLADPGNSTFRQLHQVLENRYRELHAQGVGTTRRQAEVIIIDEEEQLWQSGVLSSESPLSLIHAVFYLNGVNFVLRGGDEHRKLKLSQFKFRDTLDPDNPGEVIRCVEYTEHGSKNRHGGRLQLNQENKVVTQFARPQLGDRCHVFLLELYMSKLPDSALQTDTFYMKPKDRIPASPGESWYANSPLGHNTLGKFLKEILKEGKVDAEYKSNHSLRSTAITRMFENKIPEKLIMERSGHLSVGGLLSYEHSTMAQKKEVCKLLQSVPQVSCTDEHKKVDWDKGERDAKDSGKKAVEPVQDHAAEVLRSMQFSNMSGCTFNFTVR